MREVGENYDIGAILGTLFTERDDSEYSFTPHKGRRKQQEKDKYLHEEAWGPLMKAASSVVRATEDESDYAAADSAGDIEYNMDDLDLSHLDAEGYEDDALEDYREAIASVLDK